MTVAGLARIRCSLFFFFFFPFPSFAVVGRMDSLQKTGLHQTQSLDKTERPVAPDQFEEKYRTTRQEIWAYYSCVNR